MKNHPVVKLCLLSLACLLSGPPGFAATVKDREGAVRGDRAIVETFSRWIYNDYDLGFEEAKKTGKPVLVVLRCLPCKGCMGLDASILEGKEIGHLLDEFVCVRLINANALDLAKFQFDYDLSFSTIFFNADGTIYGRYGSWMHQKDETNATTEGYKAALQAALAMHKSYPANKAGLEGKQGGPAPFKTPVEIPALADKYGSKLDWDGNVVKSCVHCHQVGDAFRAFYRDKGQKIPLSLIYPMPAPETVGLTLAPNSVARVTDVQTPSWASAAGFQNGDEIESLDGQKLISIADFAWALHRAPDQASLKAVVKRGGSSEELTLNLPQGWRFNSDIGRRVGTWPMRAMAFGGMKLDDISDEEREKRGIHKDVMALEAMHVGQYGNHAMAKKAGFQKGDVIVDVAGSTKRITESQFLGSVLQNYPKGAKIKVTVVRNGKRISLMMPTQ